VGLLTLLLVVLAATSMVFASEGKFKIKTEDGNTFRFGGQMRMIPTSETDYDFGLGSTNFGDFRVHTNESGSVSRDYIRVEARLYFTAEDKDKKWDFYSALEFDSAVDQNQVDRRGRDYGLERLHGSVAIPGFEQVRLHAGWDIYYMDAVTAGAGFIYGDDDPGIWITGDFENLSIQGGYHKKFEDNFLSRDQSEFGDQSVSTFSDNERDLYDLMLTYDFDEDNELRLMGSLDIMKTRSEGLVISANKDKGADVKTYRIGALYTGKLGMLEPEFEFVYQGGTADNAVSEFGAPMGDFDISAYALYADVAVNLTDIFGFKVIPHVGFMYTSGDDDGTDDDLGGYMGVANAQRFTPRFGGEDTIIGDQNTLLGTNLYGYIPEGYGSMGGTQFQGGVATGGLSNGALAGRGDNPGMTMIGGGITIEPKEYISYRTLFMWFEWNEDFAVNTVGSPLVPSTAIDSGTAGQQWSNSLRVSLSKHVHIFGNATWFWPDEAVEDVTAAYGNKSDDVAQRYAVALIWRF
jgi:hypothetical protein